MKRAISILSGGVDSTVSTAIACKKNIIVELAVTFDYGQRAVKKEIEASAYICEKLEIEHRVITLDFLKEVSESSLTVESSKLPDLTYVDFKKNKSAIIKSAKNVWVPNRNGLFINVAATLADAKNVELIITGFNKEEAETFPDNSKEFIDAVNKTLEYSTLSKSRVVSYTADMSKKEIMETAIENDIDIKKLWPCYESGQEWCGRCEPCLRTLRALNEI